jgi:hypothetical protein
VSAHPSARAAPALRRPQAQLDITTIFVADVPWEDMKPALGAAPDPFRLAVSPPSKSGPWAHTQPCMRLR